MSLHTTLDGLLNRRISLEQPRDGYRVAIDTVFLAASVPAQTGQKVLEFGAGVGGGMLCLAARVPELHITGIEIQPELVAIGQRNIARNNQHNDVTLTQGDVRTFSPPALYDHVMINPPYYDNTHHDQSPNTIKRTANSTEQNDFPLWVQQAKRSLKPTGTLTIIHHADMATGVEQTLLQNFSGISRLDLLPKADKPARRVIFRATQSGTGLTTCQPLVLHNESGGYSHEAEEILRYVKDVKFIGT